MKRGRGFERRNLLREIFMHFKLLEKFENFFLDQRNVQRDQSSIVSYIQSIIFHFANSPSMAKKINKRVNSWERRKILAWRNFKRTDLSSSPPPPRKRKKEGKEESSIVSQIPVVNTIESFPCQRRSRERELRISGKHYQPPLFRPGCTV